MSRTVPSSCSSSTKTNSSSGIFVQSIPPMVYSSQLILIYVQHLCQRLHCPCPNGRAFAPPHVLDRGSRHFPPGTAGYIVRGYPFSAKDAPEGVWVVCLQGVIQGHLYTSSPLLG